MIKFRRLSENVNLSFNDLCLHIHHHKTRVLQYCPVRVGFTGKTRVLQGFSGFLVGSTGQYKKAHYTSCIDYYFMV